MQFLDISQCCQKPSIDTCFSLLKTFNENHTISTALKLINFFPNFTLINDVFLLLNYVLPFLLCKQLTSASRCAVVL